MRLAVEEETKDSEPRELPVGLLYGIGPREIRLLCDDLWEGGRGKSLAEVADMSLDQIYMLLTDKKNLRSIKSVVEKSSTMSVASKADKDGLIPGRAADGTAIKARITGKSLASRLMDQEKAKEVKSTCRQRKKRRRHGN
jgi:hypothetical protein